MAYSYVVYTGNGSTTQYAIPFQYIKKEHVKVFVNFVDTAYTFLNNTTVQLATAPANGLKVEVRRITPASTALVDFVDGSTLVASDLDTSNLQHLFLEQELDDTLKQTLSIDSATGLLTANNQRITGVGAPVAANDAATKTYVDNFASQTANIAAGAVTTAKLADGAVTSAKMDAATVVTNAEVANVATNDTSFFTTSASDLRYFRQDSTETIASGNAWSSSDSFIATTGAIDARIIDLVDDVGGFVPIANETSFPAANPDINNPDGAGTIISIKEIATTQTPVSGTVTIANGSGANTVTITGCGSTVLAAGFGVLVETTATLHTYAFHRLVPKATEVTTVAGISANVTTVAGSVGNIGTVAAGIANVNATGGSIANVNTVATNLANVITASTFLNQFVALYLGTSATNPSVDPLGNGVTTGDLYFNTTANQLKVYNGADWQAFGENAFGNTFVANKVFSAVYTAAAGSNTINLGDLAIAAGVFSDENVPTNSVSLGTGAGSFNLGDL